MSPYPSTPTLSSSSATTQFKTQTPSQPLPQNVSKKSPHRKTQENMNDNLVIALIVLILLGLTGIVYLYTFHWRSQARVQLHVARAESRKRRTSASQSQSQPQSQAIIIRGSSRPPSPLRQLHPPPARPGSTTSRQGRRGRRGRSRGPEAQGDRQGSVRTPPEQQTGSESPQLSKNQQKKGRKQQQKQRQQQRQRPKTPARNDWNAESSGQGQWTSNDAFVSGGRGDNSAPQESSSQAVNDEWGGGNQSQQNDMQNTRQQDDQGQSGNNDSGWRHSTEAVAGGSDGAEPATDWGNQGNNEGQQETSGRRWHADDPLEDKAENTQINYTGGGEGTQW